MEGLKTMWVRSHAKIAMFRDPQTHQSGLEARTGSAWEIDTAMRFSGTFSFVAADSATLGCVCRLSVDHRSLAISGPFFNSGWKITHSTETYLKISCRKLPVWHWDIDSDVMYRFAPNCSLYSARYSYCNILNFFLNYLIEYPGILSNSWNSSFLTKFWIM